MESSIVVHVVYPGSLQKEQARACLDACELERAARFKHPLLSEAWSHHRAALRHVLGSYLGIPAIEVPLSVTGQGKPVLLPPWQDVHFNLSHCDELALIAISPEGPLGIDVEPLHRASGLPECESTFCHAEELAALPTDPVTRARRLLEIWTAKEAFLKAVGTGLLLPPELTRIDLDGETPIAIGSDGISWPLIRLDHPTLNQHIAHLCVLRPINSVEILAGLPRADQLRPS